jgi:hypothetical protein
VTPLDHLGLSVRTRQALRRAGIATVEELTAASSAELRTRPGIGGVTVHEIERVLDDYQLSRRVQREVEVIAARDLPVIRQEMAAIRRELAAIRLGVEALRLLLQPEHPTEDRRRGIELASRV